MIRFIHVRIAVLVHTDHSHAATAEEGALNGAAAHGDAGVAAHATAVLEDSELVVLGGINVAAAPAAAEHVAVEAGGAAVVVGKDADISARLDFHVGAVQNVAVFAAAIHIAVHVAAFDGDIGVDDVAELLEVFRSEALARAVHIAAVDKTVGGVSCNNTSRLIASVNVALHTNCRTALDGDGHLVVGIGRVGGVVVAQHSSQVAAAIHAAVDGSAIDGDIGGRVDRTRHDGMVAFDIESIIIECDFIIGAAQTRTASEHVAAFSPVVVVQADVTILVVV